MFRRDIQSCSPISLVSLLIFYTTALATSSRDLLSRQYDKTEIKVDESKHDAQFFTFVSRPDIDAPRFNLTTYDENGLAPGYIFTTAYGVVEQTDNAQGYVGPYIYDTRGELIWSGAPLFDKYGTFDFKVSKMNDEDVLSTIYPEGGAVYLLDSSYETKQTLRVGRHDAEIPDRRTVNIHDFQIVGDSFLVLNRKVRNVSRRIMGQMNYQGPCKVQINGFQKADLATGHISFEWSPENRISLEESYMDPVKCDGDGWDYAHLNSIDTFPDGDYLVSARHVNTIYKISQRDGSIVWRLNGKQSDFQWIDNGHFLGQHDARFLFQNDTHLLISLMDNAIGPGTPGRNNDCSRGLILALAVDQNPMTVQVVSHFDHPQGDFATARGNVEVLSNGNAFIGWSDKAFFSEHTPDGAVLLEAYLPSGLKSYRTYKYPWVGHPKQPPDAHSEAVNTENSTTTTVHVSWNGATEVAEWHLFKATGKGDHKQFLLSAERKGFETVLTHGGLASFVVIEAVDRHGAVLGSSNLVKTVQPHHPPAAELAKEIQWLQEHAGVQTAPINPILAFVLGALLCLLALLCAWLIRKAWQYRSEARKQLLQSYQPLLYASEWEGDEDDCDQHDRGSLDQSDEKA